jgi:hypothetical protein
VKKPLIEFALTVVKVTNQGNQLPCQCRRNESDTMKEMVDRMNAEKKVGHCKIGAQFGSVSN